MMEELLYKKYLKETFDESGRLTAAQVVNREGFNFGFDVVDALAEKNPEKLAMMWCNDKGAEHAFSFGDMKRYSNKAANVFKSLGVKKGDAVMLVLKRHYQFWFAIVALHKLGAMVIPATNLLTAHDFDYRFNAASVKAIVCTLDGEVSDHVEEGAKTSPSLTVKLATGEKPGWYNFDKLVEEATDVFVRPTGEDAIDCSQPMLMYFTSGTTGLPKIVAHDFTYPLAHIITAVHWHRVKQDGLHFTVADTGWGKAVWGKLYGQWLAEAAVFTYDFDKFNPSDVMDMIAKYRVTTFCAPPTIYRFFIKEDLSKHDLSSLTYCTIAGEALNPEVYNQFYNATGIKLMEGFGQTETTLTVANLYGMEPKPGSMGMPSPIYNVDVVDDQDHSVKPGVVGEIVLRTDNGKPCGMFCGYYRDQARTDAAWHDNVYHTGDMAWKDEDGYFWYVGRTDDLIKSSGYRIGPFEIESVLMEHPGVLECAITGVPDAIRGQVVKATVVLARGYTASDELRKELQNYVKTHTAPYKYPRILEFVDELPKTISGKIRRVEIREQDKAGN